ncbi:hypothetical protein GGU10DRAFT_336502 [Lentinula aff. detonsa]|uniref:Uncharacterized protein n=1 Tax=Lentinula aff. detonsa TaxID=2804958 RepID=A0AA38KX09_9AGAR|nr:hypothetical protein GGU10DRAFT_336502 [Lentinula aff. detonsa]
MAPGTSYPFQQQMQMTTPFANFGYPTPMMTAQGMSSSVPTTPLRITVRNLITHSDNCTMCMGYVAHLITASDFNKVISERDGLIKGATTSSTNPQGHELVVNSLQEQIASTLRSHKTERQTLNDRITTLKLKRNELRTRHESDAAQLDEIIRDCQEANEQHLYWKDQYYDLRDHGDRYNAEARAEASQTKSLDKGKGREVPMVPLQSRIASIKQRVAREINTPRKVEEKRSVRMELAQGHFEEAPTEPLVSSTTRITPNMGEKRKREAAGQPSDQHALGKQREKQNKINRESRHRMDALSAQRAREEGCSPPPKRTKGSKNKEYDALRGTVTRLPFQAPVSAEEVETIVKALNESDNVRPLHPMWKTVHGMIAMHKQARQVPCAAHTAMQDTMIDKFIAVPRWFATEMNRQGCPLPHLFEPRASQKEAKGFTMADIMPNEAGPSNVTSASATVDTGNDLVIPTAARGMCIARSPTVLTSRVWHGCRENDSITKWAESILGSSASERLNDYSHASPPTVRLVAHKLAIRGYTKSHLQDIALYLLWWLHDVAPTIASCWIVIQQQFVHVVLDILAHHVFQGVPRTTVDVENYVFPDGSQSSNIDNAGRYTDYSVVLTYVRPLAQQLADQNNTLSVAGTDATQPTAAPSTASYAIEMAPRIIDWDDTQFNATGDPVIDYGEDDGMDMAGYTQPQV